MSPEKESPEVREDPMLVGEDSPTPRATSEPPRDASEMESARGGGEQSPRLVDPEQRPRTKRPKASTPEQPPFLESFPDSPELIPVVNAFLRGDYATVRRQAPRVAESTEDEAVREAALELGNRIRPDPLVRYVLAATGVLLLLLIVWTYGGHAH